MTADFNRAISKVSLRPRRWGGNRLIAVFSFRHDADLVPSLVEHLSAVVDGYACFDDRSDHAQGATEPTRRNALNEAARELGASYILAIDPDERFEAAAAPRIRKLIARQERAAWAFAFREMHDASHWRCDGVWGVKKQARLYPIEAVSRPLSQPLHGPWFLTDRRIRIGESGLNLYHFRHAQPDLGSSRRDTYAALDPARDLNAIGYDYLADPFGRRLAPIPEGRGYAPAMPIGATAWPAPSALSPVAPDPPQSLLRLAAANLRLAEPAQAVRTLDQLAERDPQDTDFPTLARQLSELAAPMTKGQAPPIGDAWRRWVIGAATLTEGPVNGQGPLAVIVLGFRAREDLGAAVGSVATQSEATEIVVVHSGGGDVQARLGPWRERVRLVAIDVPLAVGAARNIGIDASRAPLVAFLAGDCVAQPGWVDERLAAHATGAVSVASAVTTTRPDRLAGQFNSRVSYATRAPDVAPGTESFYGRSYHRAIFARIGYFAPALQFGEDTEFHSRLDEIYPRSFAAKVVTRHDDDIGFGPFLADTFRRFRRRGIDGLGTSRLLVRDILMDLGASCRQAHAILATQSDPRAAWRFRLASVAYRLAAAAGLRQGHHLWLRSTRLLAAARLARPGTSGGALALAQEAALIRSQDSDAQRLIAHYAFQTGGLSALAEGALLAAHHLAPSRPEPIAELETRLFVGGRLDEADVILDAACSLAPTTAAHHQSRARVALAMGDLEKALVSARKAVALALDNPDAHRALAMIHDEMGNPTMAAKREKSAADLARFRVDQR